MTVTKGDIVFFVLWGLSLGVLWWLSARLHDRRFGEFLWDLIFRSHALVRRLWVFSAETVARQEAEFVNEHPLDFSAWLPWLVRALLSILYSLALWACSVKSAPRLTFSLICR